MRDHEARTATDTAAQETTPTPRQIDDALAIVHSPVLVADQPALRVNAWQILKAARGQTVATARLDAMQHTLHHARGAAIHLLNPMAGRA